MDPRKTHPLSPTQQGLLFHYLRDGRSGVDVVQLVCELPEAVDPPALRKSWQAAAERHEGLRAAFDWAASGVARQRFESAIELDWTEEDWSSLGEAEQSAKLDTLLREERARGFDLSQAPLWRIHLIRFGECNYRCIWTLHHIVADGRSCAYVLEEVFATPGAQVAFSPAVPSRQFLAWLERRDTAQGDEAFWRSFLSGITGPTRIVDGGRPEGSGRDQAELRLSRDTTRALHEAARRHGVTLNTLVQAAWGLVLARHAASNDVIFGVIRAGRAPALDSEARAVGVFINTVPMRVRVDPDEPLTSFLQQIRSHHVAIRPHEHALLANVQKWSETGGASLFDSILIFDHAALDGALRALGGAWERRRVHHIEHTGYPLTAYGYGEEEMLLRVAWAREHVAPGTGARLLRHFASALTGMIPAAVERVRDVPVLEAGEVQQLVREWNDTAADVPDIAIHNLFAARVAEQPDAPAVVDATGSLTFAELDARAAALSLVLAENGVSPGDLVGICLERTVDLPAALFAVLRTGAAYVPLDPDYPPERIAFMAQDAGLRAILTQRSIANALPPSAMPRLYVEDVAASDTDSALTARVGPGDLAYVIYTSGSTGRPKGVMVEHRNVVNFFEAMDRHIERAPDDAWLALTSLSFDISVLELLWTLTRGMRVVLHADATRSEGSSASFSLFYFASGGEGPADDRYRLLLDGARWADAHDFEAVWTPERHFHAFGGLFPNPAVTGAAVAAVTQRVAVRAGSVVLPLHHPARVAEEWAVVDRLSGGRVGISVASGWHPEDFVLAPDRFEGRREGVFESLDAVRRLWRGEAVNMKGPTGEVAVRTMPRPVQAELPVWMTTSGTRATFERAGAEGLHLLTHLLGQTLGDLAENIAAYRRARAEHGHDPASGRVTLMVHTFVAEDDDSAREAVRAPLISYLASAVDLVRNFADAWTAVSRRTAPLPGSGRDLLKQLSPEDREALLAFSFERYFETSGLLGSVEKCTAMARAIRAAGVDEIACLIDFGVDADRVLRHLELLDRVRLAAAQAAAVSRPQPLGGRMLEHGVTHIQCTPSRARLLLAEPDARAALRSVRCMLVGGEALSADVARELTDTVGGTVLNMYGPTETTVWSTVYPVPRDAPDGTVPIGRPIANTTVRVVAADGGLAPVGVQGELWIGGRGVARGYLHQQALTDERFVPDPWQEMQRVYRTGDIVRWRADGVLEFLGRNDQQLKIRGHRVEMGEIEAVLAAHPGVERAAVAAHDDHDGGVRLVGYVVPRNGRRADLAPQVRAFAADRLPAPMVPGQIMILDAFPSTPNGKLDRRALPLPDREEEVRASGEVPPPASAIEQLVAEVWRDVLGIERIGVTDNFFDLGGHSLLTIQVQSRLRQHLSRDVPITDIFRFPTVRSLSAHLEGEKMVEGAQTGTHRAELRRQALLRRARRGS